MMLSGSIVPWWQCSVPICWIGATLLVLAGAARAQAPASYWRSYHDYAALTRVLTDLAARHPDRLQVRSLARTAGGREIWLATITRRPPNGEKPEVLFDGATHGTEVIGAESMLAYIRFLVGRYPSDTTARSIVDGWVTYVIPMVNPDGVEAGKRARRGKEARRNGHGVDVNRNFDWHWSTAGSTSPGAWDYRGPAPFSEVESRAVRDFIRSHAILVYLNGHAGTGTSGQLITESAGSPDDALFDTIGSEIERLAGFRHTRGHLAGEAGHWAYWTGMQPLREKGAHPLAVTLEIYSNPQYQLDQRSVWWKRYTPPDGEQERWIDRVRQTLIYLTQFSPRLRKP
jgi:hypothetical protein